MIYRNGKKGTYYLRYKIDGKDNRIRLLDTAGNPVRTKADAEEAARRLLAHVKEKDRAEQLRKLKRDIQDAEEAAEVAEMELKNSCAQIAKGWELFMACPKRPASCKRFPADAIPRTSNVANYRAYYYRFRDWMHGNHSDVRVLSDVTQDQAAEFMEIVRDSGAPGTYNKYLQFFNLFYKILIDSNKIKCENPFRDIDRMENRYHSKRPLTLEQIAKLIDSANGEMRLLIALGYFTGLRFGDCCTLLWREIDLIRGVIERIPRKTEHTVRDIQEAKIKVGIPRFLFGMFSDVPQEDRSGYVLPTFAKDYLEGREYKVNRLLMDHFEACGIQTIRPGTGTPEVKDKSGKVIRRAVRAVVECGFHSLRYSYISHNAELGTPAAVIQKNAGHSSPAMTEHYTRISDRAALQYANAMQLPLADDPAIDPEDPERKELQRIAETWDIGKLKKILVFANSL